MARPCGPCSDKRRIELDRRLLEKDLTGESFRRISEDFGYSETALRRHLETHIAADVGDVREAMITAREAALAEIKARELEDVKEEIATEARESIASRLDLCRDHFEQLRILRERAALALETAEGAEDVKTALLAIKELRELVRLWGELEGKLQSQPQITIINSPEWLQLKTVIVTALRPHPEALEAVLEALPDDTPRSG